MNRLTILRMKNLGAKLLFFSVTTKVYIRVNVVDMYFLNIILATFAN